MLMLAFNDEREDNSHIAFLNADYFFKKFLSPFIILINMITYPL